MSRTLMVMLLYVFFHGKVKAQEVFQSSFTKMGSAFDLTIVAAEKNSADNLIRDAIAEVDRIEALISSWNINSETSLVNQMAGKQAVQVSKELFDLVFRAKAIARLTTGAFDPTYASVDKIWHFNGQEVTPPHPDRVALSVAKIGFEKIQMNKEKLSLYLPEEGMKIGFGAIGKGYAADRVKSLLTQKGVTAGIINAAGDMSAWGVQPNGQSWQVGLVNPKNKNKVFAWFPIVDQAVVTSGDYEKYIQIY